MITECDSLKQDIYIFLGLLNRLIPLLKESFRAKEGGVGANEKK